MDTSCRATTLMATSFVYFGEMCVFQEFFFFFFHFSHVLKCLCMCVSVWKLPPRMKLCLKNLPQAVFWCVCVCACVYVCVVLITFVLSTKHLPHFSPANTHKHTFYFDVNIHKLPPSLLTLHWWSEMHLICLLSHVSLSTAHNTSVILKLPHSLKTHTPPTHTHTHTIKICQTVFFFLLKIH